MSAPTMVDVLLAELDEGALDVLAERLAPRLGRRLVPSPPQEWFDSKGARTHMSMTKDELYKRTAAREIPFYQEGPGCKLWFKRSELDAWRRGERPVADATASKTLPRGLRAA